MKKLIIILSIFVTGTCVAQENIFNGHFNATTTYIGIEYERILADRIGLAANVGLLGIGTSAKIYMKEVNYDDVNVHLGLSYHAQFGVINWKAAYGLTLNTGIDYFSYNNMFLGLDLGMSMHSASLENDSDGPIPMVTFKVGKIF